MRVQALFDLEMSEVSILQWKSKLKNAWGQYKHRSTWGRCFETIVQLLRFNDWLICWSFGVVTAIHVIATYDSLYHSCV